MSINFVTAEYVPALQPKIPQPPMRNFLPWCRVTILSFYFVTLLFCSSFNSLINSLSNPAYADPRKKSDDPIFTSNDEHTAAAIALAERFTITVLREVYRMQNLPPDMPPHQNTSTLAFRAPPRSHVVADLHDKVLAFLASARPNILVAFQRTVFQNCRRFGFYTDSDIARHGFNLNASLRIKPQWIHHELNNLYTAVVNPPKEYIIFYTRRDHAFQSQAELHTLGDLELDTETIMQRLQNMALAARQWCSAKLTP